MSSSRIRGVAGFVRTLFANAAANAGERLRNPRILVEEVRRDVPKVPKAAAAGVRAAWSKFKGTLAGAWRSIR